jgi:hypothetical protein
LGSRKSRQEKIRVAGTIGPIAGKIPARVQSSGKFSRKNLQKNSAREKN